MYNIALTFYGEARNWENNAAKNIEKFKNLDQNKFNTDVYFHLWNNITRRCRNINTLIQNKANLDNICVIKSNLQHEELLNKLQPVNYKIENKNVLDKYIDKFNPSNEFMSSEDIKLAVKYSNTPAFSQLYSMSQSFDVIENKDKYDLIIIVKTDCLFDDQSITNKTLEFYCKYINERESLLVERMSFVPGRKEPWIYHVYLLGNAIVFNNMFDDFPKIPIGMGMYTNKVPIWKGSSHAELANYILYHTNIHRVWPILHQSHPRFIGRTSQFKLEVL